MNWDAAGAIGEILGAALVVVTLLYLARQIRLNTKAVTSDVYQTHMDSWNALCAMIIERPEVAELLLKSKDEQVAWSEIEAVRFEWLATRTFALWEHWYSDYLKGMFSEADALSWNAYFRDLTNTPGFRSFWNDHREWYFDKFIEHVDQAYEAAKQTSVESTDA